MNGYWYRARVHPTWHFTVACSGIVAGVALAKYFNELHDVGWAIIAIVLIAFSFWRQRRVWLMAAFLGGSLFGLWRGSLDQQNLVMYRPMYGKHVQLSGKVKDDSETNRRGQLVLQLNNVSNEGRPLVGDLWVTTSANDAIRRGDIVTIDGALDEGFGNYAAVMYDAKLVRVTREQPGDIALAVRDDFSEKISMGIDEPAASLGTGYLLGQKRALPEHLQEALMIAGLTHIVVASGYNLTILVRLARRLFEKVSKYLAVLSSGLLIGGFIAITGLSPSMTRAGLVAGLGLWAWYYGRKFHPITLLLFAAAVTVVVNPGYAWGNLGWALSFAAFAGVMIVAPLLQAYFYGNDRPGFFIQLLGESVAAQIATAPIILLAFGQFSNVAIFSNIVILPFIPFAMLLTFLTGLAGYVVPALASFVGWPAEVLLQAMIRVVEWSAGLSWAQSEWQFDWWHVGVWYVVLGALCWYVARKTKYSLRNASLVE